MREQLYTEINWHTAERSDPMTEDQLHKRLAAVLANRQFIGAIINRIKVGEAFTTEHARFVLAGKEVTGA